VTIAPRDARAWAELLPPFALLVWRLAACPPSSLWRDAALILSLYWIFTVLAYRTRCWLPVTAGVILLLFVLSASIHLPFAINVLKQVQ